MKEQAQRQGSLGLLSFVYLLKNMRIWGDKFIINGDVFIEDDNVASRLPKELK